MKTAAAYIRVSTEDQTEYSPDSQRRKILEYADTHHILLPERFIFQDEGISGRSAQKRPAFMTMIGMAKQTPRPFDLILVWKFSRFARNRQDSILYKSMLRKECQVSVVSVTEQLSDDPTAILIEALLEAMDEYYSINLAQEVKRGINEKFSRGGVVSIPPFGYRMGTEHFEPDPNQAPFISMIFQDYLAGASCRQIAVKLNKFGIHTARGNSFESRSIEYILTNPTYLGKLRRSLNGKDSPMQLVSGQHPALIDQETYHLVQQQITKSKKNHHAHTSTSPVSYMLQGLVRCSYCGSTLTTAEKGQSLQCYRYAKGLCSKSHHVRLNILNHAVLTALKTDLHTGTLDIHIRKPLTPDPLQTFSCLLKQESRRLERVKTAYESGIDTLEEYQKNKKTILKRIQDLKKEIRQQEQNNTQTVMHIQISLEYAVSQLMQKEITESSKNALLKACISHITFYRSENAIQLHYHT